MKPHWDIWGAISPKFGGRPLPKTKFLEIFPKVLVTLTAQGSAQERPRAGGFGMLDERWIGYK